MTKQEAKRWVCKRVCKSLVAGLLDEEAEDLSPADQTRITEAVDAMVAELARRAGENRTDA